MINYYKLAKSIKIKSTFTHRNSIDIKIPDYLFNKIIKTAKQT